MSVSELQIQTALKEITDPNTEKDFIATKSARNIKVSGGGISGWAGAISHGLARALVEADEAQKPTLRRLGLLTRDSRMRESKHYGLKRARKAPQYTKR